MNDASAPPPADTPPAQEKPAAASGDDKKSPTDTTAPEVVAKKPGIIRKAAVIFLVIIIALSAASFPFVIEPWVIAKAKSSLADYGLQLNEDSQLTFSVFDGAIGGKNIQLSEIDGEKNVLIAKDLYADIAFMDSLTTGDVVIAKLTVDGLTGSLRRTTNGRIPILQPVDEPVEPGKPTDWIALGKQLLEWYKKYAPDSSKEQDPNAPPPEPIPPQAKPATDWPNAVVYEPQPQPGTQWPRVVIHDLLINGTNFGLPDDSPFDVTDFSLTGKHVALRLRPDEVMTLDGKVGTKGSGPLSININRAGGESGTMLINADAVSLKALSDPAISGDSLTHYGTTGTTDLKIETNWKGWQQTSVVTSQLKDVAMQPTKDAGDQARQLASAINAFEGKPVTWSPTVGGTLYAPVFTDYGIKSLQASALDAGKEKVIDEGTKLLNKELDKNPDVKNATDKAKDLFKGFGK